MKDEITIPKEWAVRLIEIANNMNEPRGTQDAPSRYTFQYLFGYIKSIESFLNKGMEI